MATKIHAFVFAIPNSDDGRLDRIIHFKIAKNSWIQVCFLYTGFLFLKERHLDLPFMLSAEGLSVYQSEISKINSYRAPKDKLVIIENSMKILASALFYFPWLIYVRFNRINKSTHREQ